METTIRILAVLIISLVAVVVYLVTTERNEFIRRAAELKDWFKNLSDADIQPQPDWPAWARSNYDFFYKNYRKTFDQCAYRMQHLVASKYTVQDLEGKFYWLHQQQESLQKLLQVIEKYRKVPEMKIQLQERYESLHSQIEQLSERSIMHSQYEVISRMLDRAKTDDQDKFPDTYRSLEWIKDDLDRLEKDLAKPLIMKAV